MLLLFIVIGVSSCLNVLNTTEGVAVFCPYLDMNGFKELIKEIKRENLIVLCERRRLVECDFFLQKFKVNGASLGVSSNCTPYLPALKSIWSADLSFAPVEGELEEGAGTPLRKINKIETFQGCPVPISFINFIWKRGKLPTMRTGNLGSLLFFQRRDGGSYLLAQGSRYSYPIMLNIKEGEILLSGQPVRNPVILSMALGYTLIPFLDEFYHLYESTDIAMHSRSPRLFFGRKQNIRKSAFDFFFYYPWEQSYKIAKLEYRLTSVRCLYNMEGRQFCDEEDLFLFYRVNKLAYI